MKFISTISFYFILLFSLSCVDAFGQKFTKVPTQYLELLQLLGYENNYRTDTVEAFELSNFITYKEYKNYLNSIKSDSSKQYYYTQLPDTNITIEKDVYQEYITSNAYDKYPVLGISWENAMNYCRWKTLEDNKKGEINFIYRLPKHSEWLSALNYYKTNKIKNDLDQKYSDWLLNTFDETAYNFAIKFDYVYLYKKNDPAVLKRKRIVGESYLYYTPSYLEGYPKYRYGYSNIGYQQISFRIVKTRVDKSILEYWGIDK